MPTKQCGQEVLFEYGFIGLRLENYIFIDEF